MLWFLAIAAKQKFVVDVISIERLAYWKGRAGNLAITQQLDPEIMFAGGDRHD